MGSPAAQIAREFYRAVAEMDGPALEALVVGRFADDACVVFPGSLPYGGTVTGAASIAKMFARMAASPRPAGVTDLILTDLIGDGSRLAALIEFAWHAPGSVTGIPTSAVELWTFVGDRVQEIRAFYWDTAALIEKNQ